jgi:hypothetical protein
MISKPSSKESVVLNKVISGLQVFAKHSEKESLIHADNSIVSVRTSAELSEMDLIELDAMDWYFNEDNDCWEKQA